MTIGQAISLIDDIESTGESMKRLLKVLHERQFTSREEDELTATLESGVSLLSQYCFMLQNVDIKNSILFVPYEKEMLKIRGALSDDGQAADPG